MQVIARPRVIADEIKPKLNNSLPKRINNFLTRGLYVSDNDNKDKGIYIPYPLLSAFIGLFIWLAGATGAGIFAFAKISTSVDSMSNTVLIRDAQNSAEVKRMQDQLDTLNERYNQTRIELARMKGNK